ncbi:hypothetical protein WR25_15707 isoform A [Diploscapter pachys]|uniref:SEC7 domain-containing protein n=1 Tax=Diploscapter pachys TaxID=2018661 RepID=A0A2A2J3S9_9BILA|nr:hypothetical protein WR25_15707 isoform A [Diploscapter pachys]
MSPRLSSRRFIPVSCGGGIADGRAEVWVPRASLAHSNKAHSNSLPRLEKHVVERLPYSEASSSTSHLPRYVTEQDRKRQYRIALNFFNKKPDRGVALLNAWGFVDETPESLARLLFGRRGLSKLMIGEYIGTLHSQFHSLVLKYFISLIDLRGLEVDVALRKAMQFFILPKEAEKIDRIIQAFAIHYSKCNPRRAEKFRGGWDTVHLISFAVIMLNTDLHSPNLKQNMRMKKEDFVKNLKGQDKASGEKEGVDIDRSVLEGIYERVQLDEIQPGDDHVAQVARVDRAILGKDKPRLTETQRRLVCYCRLQQVLDIQKKQSALSHERDVFLFNDMLVIAKSQNRKRTSIGGSYALKHWLVLLGASVHEFQRNQYDFGLTIISANKEVLHFNARNNDDRCRFVADVRESIRECCEMDTVRLELETEQLEVSRITVADNQRDSGLPDDAEDSDVKMSFQRDGNRSIITMNGNSGSGSPSSSDGNSHHNHGSNVVNSGNQLNPLRRLSFNSLDSGVVEETYE